MPLCAFEDLLACLEIEGMAEGGEHGERYSGPNLELPYHRIFGGQLLAQAIIIASKTVEAKRVKSIHVTFPRQGDLREPVDYRVERVQDGRTFATRWITGSQASKPIFTAVVSLHASEQGIDHQRESLRIGGPEEAVAADLSMIPWETRVVGDVDLADRKVGPPRFEFWQKTPELPDDPAIHQALFAHSTDLTMIGTSLRPHADLCEADSPETIQTAVTTHTIWFHRPVQMDHWVLVAQESPSTAGARGFGTGHAYCEGALVASFAQESMIRRV